MPISAPRYTVDQVRGFPDDGQRYELLDGMLLVTPAPRRLHQEVVVQLATELCVGLRAEGVAKVASVGELEIGNLTLLNPDILVYPTPSAPEISWKQMREWWLAVEVLSPSSRVYDREFKRPAYQAIGVEDVWIVDPDARTVEVWVRGAWEPRVERERIAWRGMTIELEKVF